MGRSLYPKFAINNIRKNGRLYFPYILACIFTIAVFYIMKSLSLNEDLTELAMGSIVLKEFMGLGCWIVAIFAVIFFFYIHSFLMKRRKSEIGLLNVLGMGKRHISRVLAFESLYISAMSFLGGIVIGIALDKIMFLVISNALGGKVVLGFHFYTEAVVTTIVLFSVIFFLVFLNSLRQIYLSRPIELLKSKSVGEKEPKAKWAIAILGILCLAVGYAISVFVKDPRGVVSLFFVAVLLVVIGTYLVFTAGSISFLKMLKNNGRYYYKTKHFIGVSGLLYRMKQNAVGLASICVLLTMVLVMLATTVSMVFGVDDDIMSTCPNDTFAIMSVDPDDSTSGESLVSFANSCGVEYENKVTDKVVRGGLKVEKEVKYAVLGIYDIMPIENDKTKSMDQWEHSYFFTLDDYNALTGQKKKLNNNEVLIYSGNDRYPSDNISIFKEKYVVKEQVSEFVKLVSSIKHSSNNNDLYIIVEDMDKLKEICQKYQKCGIYFYYGFDYNGTDEQKRVIAQMFKDEEKPGEMFNNFPVYAEKYNILHYVLDNIDNRIFIRDGGYNFSVSFLFLGAFLGVLFFMATVLMIYYKQISEGYEDRDRYTIMQKLGVSQKDIKNSIHSQILTVFFLPLITAGIHIAFALPIILRSFAILQLENTGLTLICTAFCYLVLALLYTIVYLITSRAYYRIVK